MKKIYLLVILFAAVSFSVSAQKVSGTVRGSLQDSLTATPLQDATVSVMKLSDSSLVSFTITNAKGFFEIKNLDADDYVVISSFQGLQTIRKKFSISAQKPVMDFATINMARNYKTMEEVVVKDDAPVKVKGDTLAFNADAFKTKPNATAEDLLKKLPGVQVDKDGTVKAQGEQVQKVYVDGKEFFGNDPKLATKNLTADMIDQVEIFDDMSEQAKFNKVDDGSRSKAINLKLKKDKKKGVFGKAYAGYGTDDRYDVGVNANLFKGAMQTSVIAKSNNINNIGYSVSDMLGMFSNGSGMSGMGGMMGGGGMNIVKIGSGGAGGGSFGGLNLGATGSGITSSSQLGFNYRDTWSKSFDITGSYFFNHTETRNLQSSLRQTFDDDTTNFFDDKRRSSLSDNNNHRMNLNMTWRIDSMNSIVYYPSLSFQSSKSNSDDTTSIYSVTPSVKQQVNAFRQFSNSNGEGFNWTNNLVWRKRFGRPGRTLALTLTNTMGNTVRDNYNIFNSSLSPTNTFYDTEGETRNYSAGFSYTEPISRNKIMELNYTYSQNKSESDKEVSNYNNTTGKYDIINQSQSNHFRNSNENHRGGVNFRVVQKKYNYQLGFSALQTTLISDDVTKDQLLKQRLLNFFPTASFNYQFQRSRSLRFNYRGSTRQPSITQLQSALDSSNAPYLYRGNPALKQEFSNNVTLSYNYFDILKFRNIFAFLNFTNTYNRIANAVYRDKVRGSQLTTPVNLNGYYMLNGNLNIGFPIKKMKGGNFNATTRAMLSRDPSVNSDTVKIYTKNLNLGEDLRLNYNFKEKLDMGITASINYNMVNYSSKSNQGEDLSYFTHTYSADITYTFPKNFILSTDFDYTFNTGRTAGYNQNFALWNASFAKQVFKNKRGEIKASVFDILNNNKSVTRNTGIQYVEDVRNLTLHRYFMLTMTYQITRMGGRAMPAMMEKAMKGIRITQ